MSEIGKLLRVKQIIGDEIHFAFLQKDRLDFNNETRKYWKNKHDTLEDVISIVNSQLQKADD